jgi:Domain of unknown function (DU1801)
MGKPQSVGEDMSALPEAQRKALRSLGDTIRTAAPSVQETISSGVPAFRYKGKYLVSFGAAKDHVSLYVMRGAALKMLEQTLYGLHLRPPRTRTERRLGRPILVLDRRGLDLFCFCVTGASTALDHHVGAVEAVLLGAITG